MSNSYKITGPSIISFSGGRTSGFMLRHILDAHGGTLPADVRVLFCNTGKEREETLVFVRECGERWAVPITWLEYRREGTSHTFAVVTFETASRNGEPFEQLIEARKFLPNPVTRFCTQELKIRPAKKWATSVGMAGEFAMVLGLRADEPWRIHRAKNNKRDRYRVECPMGEAGHGLRDVTAFWKAQPFDLGLRPDEGNCDLCFLKGADKLSRLIRERPESVAWWAAQEAKVGGTFRNDRPSYAHLLNIVQEQGEFEWGEDDLVSCACTD
jgi:hypothetical protein